MAYEFSFDGKSLWALGGGSAVLCVLLFFAGVLLGVNWNPHDATVASAAQPVPRPAPAQPVPGARDAASTAPDATSSALPYSPPAGPQGPGYYGAPGTQDDSARWYAPQQGGAQGYAAQSYAAQGYAPRATAPSDYAAQQRYAEPPAAAPVRDAASAPPVNAAREAARLNAAGMDADPRLVSEAEEPAAEAAKQGAAGYSVQVGAYADEPEARRLVADLENKGYTPTLFRGRDFEGRQWYAVRIGSYASQREAAQAAQNFTHQERVKAAVRPSGSL